MATGEKLTLSRGWLEQQAIRELEQQGKRTGFVPCVREKPSWEENVKEVSDEQAND